MATFAKGADVPETDRQRLQERFEGMMRALHKEQGATLRIEIMADKPIQDFIDTHADILDSSSASVKMSDDMRSRLSRSNWIFSGIKTFHELNEAFPSLINEDGSRKPFERFLNDVQKIDETYNRNYLHSEYNYVHASADMAAKWEQFMEDGDRYLLQYRTAHDDRVRPEHAELEGVTLPIDDSFWADYYPPNGWNCRCTVVQVRRGKYEITPHDEAMTRGEIALQRDTRGIFRFNSGQQRKSVPDYNPYTISACKSCSVATGDTKLSLAASIPNNELCQACRLLRQLKSQEQQSRLNKEQRRQAIDAANQWVDRHLPLVQLESGPARRLVVNNEESAKQIIINRDFVKETFAKNKNNRSLAEVMEMATLVYEWIPKAVLVGEENGIHHKCKFLVFNANYKGKDIECKAMVKSTGIYLYTMRIK